MKYCNCTKTRKVPDIEWPFLKDQRDERQIGIGPVDRVVTKKLKKRNERNAKLKVSSDTKNESSSVVISSDHLKMVEEIMPLDDNNFSSEDDIEDNDFKWSYALEKFQRQPKVKMYKQMRVDMKHTAKTADLTGASNRTVAKNANAVLEDLNMITETNSTLAVDKSKIRRAVKKNRAQLIKEQIGSVKSIKSLYFDGRKDKTLTHTIKGHQKTVLQEHIALLKEPESQYLGHVSLYGSGTAKDISNGILTFFKNLSHF